MMRKQTVFWTMLLLLLAGLIACSPTDSGAEPAVQTETEMADDAMADDAMADDAMDAMIEEKSEEEMMDEEMADDGMMDESHDDAMMDEEESGDGMMDDSHDDTMMDEEGDAMMQEEMTTAAWQTLPLVNARTGDTFTLADFAGKVVLVEPMATWCSNCRRQLNNVQQAYAQNNANDVVFIALSVETTLTSAELQAYAEQEGFEFVFSVMSEEMLQALVDQFGRTAANPPSTPHFLIRPDGSITDLTTGFEAPEQLLDAIAAARG